VSNFSSLSNFFADNSSKIIALADPVLSQPDMEREMVSPPTGASIPSFTIYHVLPDLPANKTAVHYETVTVRPCASLIPISLIWLEGPAQAHSSR
jgi:hypothetical protein